MSTALEVAPEQKAVQRSGDEMVSLIERMVKDPSVDIDKLERLIALKERIDAQSRKEAYDQALASVQANAPRIGKAGRIVVPAKEGRGGHSTPFAMLEDVDSAIRPLMAEEGFALSVDTSTGNGRINVSGTLKHRAGHSETKSVELAPDQTGSKNAVQAVGSTISYGRRYLLKMFFNLIEVGEDDDGNGGSGHISQKEADEMRDMLAELGGNAMERFLKHMGAARLSDILQRDAQKGFAAIKAVQRAQANR